MTGFRRSFCDKHPLTYCTRRAYNNIFEAIGDTPLVKLSKIPKEHKINDNVKIYVKCEFLNPGGSIKDRVAYRMMEEINNKNLKHATTTIVEPSSGNTGIGIAMNCAYNDYKCVILTTHKCANEKVNVMRLLGSDVAYVREGDSEIEAALELQNKPGYYMLDQFSNDFNPQTHYYKTAEEILRALDKVDYLVCGAGTGGTMTGTATRLKEKNPNCKLVAADIQGSRNFHDNERAHPFQVEGITGDEDPPITVNRGLVDKVEVVSDKDAFLMAREMAKKEGIMCGGSAGLAVRAAIQFAQKISEGTIVVILPDGIRNSMTKFVSDQWMEAQFYKSPPELDEKWYNAPIDDLIKTLPAHHKNLMKVNSNDNCKEVLDKMIANKADVAIVTSDQICVGLVSLDSIRHRATDPPYLTHYVTKPLEDKVIESMDTGVQLIPFDKKPKTGLVSRVLDISRYVILGDASYYPDQSNVIKTFDPKHVVSGDDISNFIKVQWLPSRRDGRGEAYCTACHEKGRDSRE